MSSSNGPRPRVTARFTGVLLLMTVAGGVFAQGLVANSLVAYTNAAVTANKILENRSLFQISYTVYLIEMACQIAMTALFYALLRPAGPNIAIVSTFIDLSASIIKTLSRVFYITPLFVLTNTDVLGAFNGSQLQALALLLLKINDRGAGMAVALFGVSGLLRGYLVYRSTFFPRALGIVCMVAAVPWLRFFYLPLRYPPFTVIAVIALAGCAVQIFWFVVYGVDEEKWQERYRQSLGSGLPFCSFSTPRSETAKGET